MALNMSFKVSLLRSNNDTLGLYHRNASYIVGFPLINHAKEVQKYVHMGSKIHINDIYYKKDKIHRLYISKKININKLQCSLVTLEIADVIMYPIMNNIGIVFALEKMDETKDELVFDCEYFDPIYNADIFRTSLM